MITEAEGQRAFPSLTAQKTASFSLGFRPKSHKGLSQIVTSDVQPQGDLSLSFQWQGKEIANPYEFQAELGITRSFEVAEIIFGCEVALVQKDPWLFTTGFINWSTQGEAPQPLLEAGCSLK